MKNLILGQLLRSVFANAAGRRGGGAGNAIGGGLGGRMPGGLGGAAIGSVLAGMIGRRGLGRMGGPGGAVVAMLLPYAMQWVQRNGGIGAVLKRVQDRGYGRQANSWVSTGDNEDLDADAVEGVIGREELDRVSRELGVSDAEVKQGFAEILPEMVDQLTPDGRVDANADDVLQESIPLFEEELNQARRESSTAT